VGILTKIRFFTEWPSIKFGWNIGSLNFVTRLPYFPENILNRLFYKNSQFKVRDIQFTIIINLTINLLHKVEVKHTGRLFFD
jgi:hypothetical protein